jgi:hypothetical protein
MPNTANAIFSGGVTATYSSAVAGNNIWTITATSTTSENVTFVRV